MYILILILRPSHISISNRSLRCNPHSQSLSSYTEQGKWNLRFPGLNKYSENLQNTFGLEVKLFDIYIVYIIYIIRSNKANQEYNSSVAKD